jgi:Trk K+ transport system NAD-binding subunit
MASFGTDHIINPYELFSRHLGIAMRASGLYLLREWLTATPDELLPEPQFPPRGHWVLCGFGRFGREMARCLASEGIDVTVIDADPAAMDGVENGISGSGTEAHVLEQAGIRHAAGLVAGTSNDVNNLSVVMTARELNPRLFVVLRRNQRSNTVLTDAVGAQLVMQPAAVVVHAAMALLTEPLLARFLVEVRDRDNAWANEVIARLVGVLGEHAPEAWSFEVEPHAAPAVHEAAARGALPVGALGRDPRDRAETLPVVPLAIERDGALLMLPQESDALRPGDRVLFCGRGRGRRKQQFLLRDANVLRYVLTGEDVPGGWIWQRLASRRHAGAAQGG